MLHDRIVCSIQDQQTQRKLLAEPELTLKKAFEVAQAIESAYTQVQELQHPRMKTLHAIGPQFRLFRVQVPQGAPVNNRSLTRCESLFAHPSRVSLIPIRSSFTPSQCTTTQRRAPSQPRTPCPCCIQMHWALTCKFCEALCPNCSKHGHMKSMCHSTPSTMRPRQQDNKNASKPQRPNKIHVHVYILCMTMLTLFFNVQASRRHQYALSSQVQ